MDKRLKIGATLTGASLIVLAVLAAIPSGPFVNIKNTIVSANPDFDNYTRISAIAFKSEEGAPFATLTENNTIADVDVGTLLHSIFVDVLLKKEYADNEAAAFDCTRVYVTLKDPSDATVYENDLAISNGLDEDTYWILQYIGTLPSDIELTEGTWTLTTKYEVYA